MEYDYVIPVSIYNMYEHFTEMPPQPDNPSDVQRHMLELFALYQKGRPEDFEFIKNLTSPQDISQLLGAENYVSKDRIIGQVWQDWHLLLN